MATTLYPSNDQSDVSGYLKLYINTRSPNASAAPSTAVTTTVDLLSTTVAMTLTAGGSAAKWISAPLAEAVTISTTPFFNVYAKESNAAANVQVAVGLAQYTTSIQTAFLVSSVGAELTTTEARIAWVSTLGATTNKEVITSTAFSVGDRITFIPYQSAIGSGRAADTTTLTYNGLNNGTGDTYVLLNEDLRATDAQIGTGENVGVRGVGAGFFRSIANSLRSAVGIGLIGTNATYQCIVDECDNQRDNC